MQLLCLVFNFNTVLVISSRADGEDLNSQIAVQCDGVVNLNETYPKVNITMPTNRHVEQDCRWDISSPPDTQIIIKFLDLRLNGNDMSIYDSKERLLFDVSYYYSISLNPNPVISDSQAYIDFGLFYSEDYSILIEAHYTGRILKIEN